jgi:hypothetical protein
MAQNTTWLRSSLGSHFAGTGTYFTESNPEEVYKNIKARDVKLPNCPSNKEEFAKVCKEMSGTPRKMKLSKEELAHYKSTGELPDRWEEME